ncbi:hypothetical protein H0H87_008864 [Tephrocybe sp. NHM501043]|nr:hypothetical protein H0H87_008864 [Tephrocybe sp. NHM501043]
MSRKLLYPESKRLVRKMQSALGQLGRLEPLDGSATPPSQREFANTLYFAQIFSERMLECVRKLKEGSNYIEENVEVERAGNQELLAYDFQLTDNEAEETSADEAWCMRQSRKRGPPGALKPVRKRRREVIVNDGNSSSSGEEDDRPDGNASTGGEDRSDGKAGGEEDGEDGDEENALHHTGHNLPGPRRVQHEAKIDKYEVLLAKVFPEDFSCHFYPSNLVHRIIEPTPGSLEKKDIEGLYWLMSGYYAVTADKITAIFDSQMTSSPMRLLTLCVENIREIERDEDPVSCMLKREKFNMHIRQAEKGQNYVGYVLRMVHTLKFQLAWNLLKKDEKGDFLDRAFHYIEEAEIQTIRIRQKTEKQGDKSVAARRQRFTRKYARRTTGRNYVLELFQKFGAGVLLNPMWEVPSERLTTGRSANFGPLLRLLFKRLPEKIASTTEYESLDQYLGLARAKYTDDLRALLEALEVDEDLLEWVMEFVDKHETLGDEALGDTDISDEDTGMSD